MQLDALAAVKRLAIRLKWTITIRPDGWVASEPDERHAARSVIGTIFRD